MRKRTNHQGFRPAKRRLTSGDGTFEFIMLSPACQVRPPLFCVCFRSSVPLAALTFVVAGRGTKGPSTSRQSRRPTPLPQGQRSFVKLSLVIRPSLFAQAQEFTLPHPSDSVKFAFVVWHLLSSLISLPDCSRIPPSLSFRHKSLTLLHAIPYCQIRFTVFDMKVRIRRFLAWRFWRPLTRVCL